VTDSISALTAGVVDYAGLFPPAALAMAPAVQAYADYFTDPHRTMLGRFVVPVARLAEFDRVAAEHLPRGERSQPWEITALVGPDVDADVQEILKFNDRHWPGAELGHAIIDSVEIKASSTAEIGAAMSRMPEPLRAFFEIPVEQDPAELIREIKRSGGNAKIRTGGVTTDAFPSADAVARFLERCRESGVAFKATAGLHHPIRAEYRLTYEPVPPRGTMYGYLNLLIAATFAWMGSGSSLIRGALVEERAHDFVFSDTEVVYRGHSIPVAKIRDARKSFAMSFGSCSFREPVDDLIELGLL